jgi:small basic protein
MGVFGVFFFTVHRAVSVVLAGDTLGVKYHLDQRDRE